MINRARNLFTRRTEGQGMIEYGLIIALVSIAAIAVLLLFGPALTGIFNQVLAAL